MTIAQDVVVCGIPSPAPWRRIGQKHLILRLSLYLNAIIVTCICTSSTRFVTKFVTKFL